MWPQIFDHMEQLMKNGVKLTIKKMKDYAAIYLLVVPPIIFIAVYRYYPIITQFVLSFKNYTIKGGIWGSKWIGWQNYIKIFSSTEFIRIIVNTLRISILQIAANFLLPILLAVMLFDMSSTKMRRFSQSILYIPHFFSWVIVYNLINIMFAQTGYINNLIQIFGIQNQDFLMQTKYFLPLIVSSNVWKELGWGTIIYLAALTAIDTELYEVAKIDGAGPVQRIWYVTIPGIIPVIVFVLTMSLGQLFTSANTEQILLFYGPQNYTVSDVIGTWVYRQGLGQLQYSLGAAVSMFQSIIGLILVLICNNIANRTAGVGIW